MNQPDQADRLREAIERKLAAHPDLLRSSHRGGVKWRLSNGKIELDLSVEV